MTKSILTHIYAQVWLKGLLFLAIFSLSLKTIKLKKGPRKVRLQKSYQAFQIKGISTTHRSVGPAVTRSFLQREVRRSNFGPVKSYTVLSKSLWKWVPCPHRLSQDFWLGEGGKPQITCNDVIKNFRKRNFLRGKDIVEWNIRSRACDWHKTR